MATKNVRKASAKKRPAKRGSSHELVLEIQSLWAQVTDLRRRVDAMTTDVNSRMVEVSNRYMTTGNGKAMENTLRGKIEDWVKDQNEWSKLVYTEVDAKVAKATESFTAIITGMQRRMAKALAGAASDLGQDCPQVNYVTKDDIDAILDAARAIINEPGAE